jgi:rhodanese-related sulfurtransferase
MYQVLRAKVIILLDTCYIFAHNELMTYKTKEKSFFETAVEKEKEEIEQLEKKGAKKVLKWYDFGASSFRAELKRHPAQYFFLFVTTFLGSVITSSIALLGLSGNLLTFFVPHQAPKTTAVKAVQISGKEAENNKFDPLLLASKLRKQDTDFEIIDIRNFTDYKNGHILHAKSIPVYDTPLVTKSGDLNPEAIKNAFKTYLGTDKTLIIYAQNAYSTLPSDISSLLTSDAKTVKALAVGWEEWLHLQTK